ncbi:hypothetical protein C3Y87_09245 [Carbonactinospora thermoautotrophica]|uniref:DUF5753 domain-containing protein n=1 Tax=Carbonactinospora thermoautotrophica TaxID=1469144 RepID=UPI00226EB4E0|nr:DUF5753 domain-containing protein [Carbonactinospora thermoautotrophica]MCX9191596.1 hypothetical protein [Carbonactinospora thermoautotrophica]
MLDRLLEAAQLPTITLQVLPFGAGAYPGMVTPFTLIGFPEQAPVAYMENLASNLYVENPEDVRRYTLLFNHLRARVADPDTSVALISEAARELERS